MRRRIGSGAFATVWLAYDEQLDSPVAIKVLADNWTEDLHARQRFIEEGRFLRKVESPHVVSVYDAGELADSRPFPGHVLRRPGHARGPPGDRAADCLPGPARHRPGRRRAARAPPARRPPPRREAGQRLVPHRRAQRLAPGQSAPCWATSGSARRWTCRRGSP
ncbi:protein kinase [Nocardioides sp. B-3]|uniref:protein kinase n=1 Tax=Nocardioides sp. B-3 TaxID=2895565 RepID=UPI0021527922|nr:protein kinase [Nocardioides sp. B-3]UUZ61315.1 protein kinase [Nocardioides sp. B-3]